MQKDNNSYDKMKRAEVPSTGHEGTTGNKTNHSEATLRTINLPPSSAVTTVDRDANAGMAARLASANPNNNPKKSIASNPLEEC